MYAVKEKILLSGILTMIGAAGAVVVTAAFDLIHERGTNDAVPISGEDIEVTEEHKESVRTQL